MASELVEKILNYLEKVDYVDTLDLASAFKEDHQKIVGAVKSIEALGELIKSETTTRKQWMLTDEGKNVVNHGSHEAMVYNFVPSDGIAQAVIMKVFTFSFYIEKIVYFFNSMCFSGCTQCKSGF